VSSRSPAPPRRRLILRRATVACGLGLGGLTAACTSSGDGSPAQTTPVSTVNDDAARGALQVVLDGLSDPASVSAERFTPEFLSIAPIERVRSVLTSLGRGQWRADGISPYGDDELIARLTGPGTPQMVYVEVDGTGRMTELVFRPDVEDPPRTLRELVSRWSAAGTSTAFLRADVSRDGACTPVAELNADRSMPLASVFKLYVLGAVATAVQQGRIRWDTEVTIRDELDSLPPYTTQNEPAGSSLWVLDLAHRMIEHSDNTATDHLIDLLGRDAVEQALVDLGHANPSATLPALTTRELFIIKSDPDLLSRYATADEAHRRTLLATEVATAPLPTAEAFGRVPRAVDTVEWFASPEDICRAWVALHRLASTPGLEPMGEMLGATSDAILDRNKLPTVWSKAGAEPGVSFVSWLAERPNGRFVVVAGGVADPVANVEEHSELVQMLARALTLQ
jgi:beta-lactamase class A